MKGNNMIYLIFTLGYLSFALCALGAVFPNDHDRRQAEIRARAQAELDALKLERDKLDL
jgi:hypothetical protein